MSPTSEQASSVNRLAMLYSESSDEARDTTVARFNGAFSAVVSVSEVIGHVVTSAAIAYADSGGVPATTVGHAPAPDVDHARYTPLRLEVLTLRNQPL